MSEIILASGRSLRAIATALRATLHYDFCPNANGYVYWLKQPVGWFVLALLCSLLVGSFLNPVGWSLAAGIFVILSVGLLFPWIAVRAVACKLFPVIDELHEFETGAIVFEVRNRLPLPLFGLMVENYLTLPVDQNTHSIPPDVGLSQVPAFSTAKFRLPIKPQLRGVYPSCKPHLACGFPFAIWTSRIPLHDIQPLTVLPQLFNLTCSLELPGKRLAEVGAGNRVSSHGEFIGVRKFRRGDSLKSIHWAQSARLDELIICERGGPQQRDLTIQLDTHASLGSTLAARENLAWRVRIAASLVDLCVLRHVPFRLCINAECSHVASGPLGRRIALNRLALIPLAPHNAHIRSPFTQTTRSTIAIGANDDLGQPLEANLVRICFGQTNETLRSQNQPSVHLIDLNKDITDQVNNLIRSGNDACFVRQ